MEHDTIYKVFLIIWYQKQGERSWYACLFIQIEFDELLANYADTVLDFLSEPVLALAFAVSDELVSDEPFADELLLGLLELMPLGERLSVA